MQALLNLPENIDISVNVNQHGDVTIGGQNYLTADYTDTYAGLKSDVMAAYAAKQTSVQKNASGRRSGGGGGSSKSTEKELSEIEKMIDLMEQLQKFSDFRQSMYSQMRDYYDTTKELQGVILYYGKERDEIEANNKVLEENLEKINALLPAQQALVSKMDVTDENYQQQADDLEKLQNAYEDYSKQLIENRTKILEYNEAIKETNKQIRQMEIDLRNTVLQAIMDREQREQDMADARIDMENEILDAIQTRYEKERDLILDNAKAKKDSLNEEKSLLDEVLRKRKEMEEDEDKQKQLLELEQKLARISADPSRRKEQQELTKQIADLRKEMAWDLAEDEVEAQKESLDQQIDSLDEYIEYVQEYYEDLFEHPQKLIEEMKGIMARTDDEIIAWLKANNEEYGRSTETTQNKMVSGWSDTLLQMHGMIKTYWEEVEWIIAQGDEYIINFLKENSQEYREAGALQAEAYVDEWREQLENLRLAHKSVIDDLKFQYEETIRLAEAAASAGSGGSRGGGGGTQSPTSTPNTRYGANANGDQVLAIMGMSDSKYTPTQINTFEKLYTTGSGNITRTPSGGLSNLSSIHSATAHGKKYNASTGKFDTKTMTKTSYASKADAENLVRQALTSAGYGYNIVISKSYKSGGLVDFTGPAWVDGTKNRPEAFLNPLQTELIGKFAKTLEMVSVSLRNPNVGSYMSEGAAVGASFGDINISVASMDSDTDVAELTDKLMEEIQYRMTRGRVVGGLLHTR